MQTQTTPPVSARAPAVLTLLALLAIVAALYLARAFIIPLLIGILASYALSPAVDWLCRWRVPRVVAAALVLAALAGGFSWMAITLGDEAAAMASTLPEAARKLRQGLSERRASGPTALHNVQQAAKEMEQAAADIAAPAKPVRAAPEQSAPAPVPWLNDFVLAQTRLLVVVLAQAPIVV
ncbi:MAG TPA: AI-2E family transporter, partial [Burkholderiales bacterium]|nr:AI-2E family transporter [Burkholderiales bacterium]